MHIAYLSNRPKRLQASIESVARHMPFVQTATVLIPRAAHNAFQSLSTAIPCTFVIEEDILVQAELDDTRTQDHQSRNYRLRHALSERGALPSDFIMADDDAHALRTIDENFFLEEQRYHSYYFYDLRYWPGYRTDFDQGQMATAAVLQQLELPTLSYASHMPQIINRELFNKAYTFFDRAAKKAGRQLPLCEWSTYFNYAHRHAPELFHPPRPFETLCWPEHPLAWPKAFEPTRYSFENYTPSLYNNKGPFSDHTLTQFQGNKPLAWRHYELSTRFPEQSTNWRKWLNWRTWYNKITRHTRM